MLDGVVLGSLGPWGLVSMFVTLIALGGLVPRWIHKERIADKQELIQKLQLALDKRDEQFDKLIAQNTVIVKLLEDLKGAAHKESRPMS